MTWTHSLHSIYSSAATVPQFAQPATAFRSSIYRTAVLISPFLTILLPCDLNAYALVYVFRLLIYLFIILHSHFSNSPQPRIFSI